MLRRAANQNVWAVLSRFLACERGGTAIEYAMIAGGVGAVVAGSVWGTGDAMKVAFYDKLAMLFK